MYSGIITEMILKRAFIFILYIHFVNSDCQWNVSDSSTDRVQENYLLSKNEFTTISFNRYYRHAEINNYLDQLELKYSKLVKVFNIGRSYENRTMKIVKISTTLNSDEIKPAIFIDAGVHAREWIAPAQALYVIDQLVVNSSVNHDLIDEIDWYILPVVNPDGYEYSHTTDRLWRKTRSMVSPALPETLNLSLINNSLPYSYHDNYSCIGVDGNRNWDFNWKPNVLCTDTFGGLKPFSEIETINVLNFAKTIADKLKLYLTFHSFANKILHPYAFSEKLAKNHEELEELAKKVNNSMHFNYTVGSSFSTLYPLTGGSTDYFYEILNVSLSYTIELPSYGSSNSGFIVQPEFISTIVTDMFNGIKTFAYYIKNKYTNN